MSHWVRLCSAAEAPENNEAIEVEVEGGLAVCVARVRGELSAIDNWCPHRRAPLGQGWIEGDAIVCPWHSWTFDLKTGKASYPENEKVDVFPLRIDGDEVMIDIE